MHICLTLELHSINWAPPPFSWHSLPASTPLGICLAVTFNLTQSLFPLDMSQYKLQVLPCSGDSDIDQNPSSTHTVIKYLTLTK